MRRSLAIAVVGALACARAPVAPATTRPPEEAAVARYFPLAVGNAWTFVDSSPQQPAPSRRTVRIVARDAEGYFVDDAKGALRVDGDCLRDRARRLLCAPLRAGASWSSVVGPSVTERYEIAGVDEEIRVPAGAFRGCVRVRSRVRAGTVDQVAELTYAPGVGPVRLETFAIVDGAAAPQIRGELESYRLQER